MATVAEILKGKGPQVWTIPPQAKVFEALKLMADKGIGALVVVKDDRVVGILSERDYARKVMLLGKSSQDTPVQDIMTASVFVVHTETKAEECMALMTDKHIRHLPVFDKDRMLGVLSIGDIVKSIITEQKITIDHLQNYILGKYQ
ncbi:MAG: CBS domain-containing protein [Candidatus Aminicenantes bacterium]|nr:CBS domain-containing protein [Candidatus Aminicenantes bacterium]